MQYGHYDFCKKYFSVASLRWLPIFLTIFSVISSSAQFNNARLVPLIPEDLYHVKAIVKDHQGFMWFGTGHGLYRYDGLRLNLYEHIKDDSSTISHSTIESLLVDHTGKIWISTNSGLNCMDPQTGSLKMYFHDKNKLSADHVGGLTEDEFGHIWIGSVNGLNEFDPQSGLFTTYCNDPKDSTSINPGSIFLTYLDRQKRFWVGTINGLDLMDRSKKTFRHFFHGSPAPTMDSWQIKSIVEDHSGMLWLGTWGEGLLRFDPKTSSYLQFWENPSKKHRGDHNIIFNMATCSTDTNILFIAGMENQFSIFDKRTLKFDTTGLPLNHHIITEECNSIYNDGSGNLWIGSYNNAYKLDIRPQKFFQFDYASYLEKDCLGCPLSIDWHETKREQQLWIGTWTCGLVIGNTKTRKVEVIKKEFTLPSKVNYHSINNIQKIDKNKWWLGTPEGILQLDSLRNISARINWNEKDNGSLSNDMINDIWVDDAGTPWVATDNGLNRYDLLTQRFIRYYPSRQISQKEINSDKILRMCKLSSGNLALIAGEKDIYYFSPGNGKFKPAFENRINPAQRGQTYYSIFSDSQKQLWCAGSFGVCRITNPETNPKLDMFTTADGLSSDYATGIAEDNCGHIWIATRKGLNMFDEPKNRFKQFFTDDGLLFNDLEGAFKKMPSGDIVIGYHHAQNKGSVNYFNPCNWDTSRSSMPVVITAFKIFGKKPVYFKDKPCPSSLEINHNDRMITFEFAALDFENPLRNQYRYRLKGFDTSWILAGNTAFASYTNLDGGDYIFQVSASTDGLHWSNNPTSVNVYIKPPFYRSWWFYTSCIIFTLSIFYAIYKIRIGQIRKLYAVRANIARDLHDDIGSRLSSISIMSQLADNRKEDPSFDVSKFYEQVKEGSRETMELMNDIVWSVNPKNDRLNDILVRMREYASEILEAKNINFQITVPSYIEQLHIPMHIRKDFYLVFKEAINNLAKYSGSTNVNISISKEQHLLTMVIHDNGNGFDINKVKKGNGLINMQSRAIDLNGKLKIYSELNQGTRITLEIPVA